MADASYDVVIVGGGNKGLVTAMYLTKYGGMSVGIFEDRHELGAGWSTEEGPAPGFLSSPCSACHFSEYHTVLYEDFPEWEEYGVKLINHVLNVAAIYPEDQTWCGQYNAQLDPTQERTAKLWARFSERDAEKWLWFWDKIQKYILPAVRETLWNPPPPYPEETAMDRLFKNPDSGLDPQWQVMTFPQVLQDIFESVEVQMPFAGNYQGAGLLPDGYGSGALVPGFLAFNTSGII